MIAHGSEPDAVGCRGEVGFEDYVADGGYRLCSRPVARGGRARTSVSASSDGGSGLRGLGGAGFPAGNKWEIVRKEPGPA